MSTRAAAPASAPVLDGSPSAKDRGRARNDGTPSRLAGVPWRRRLPYLLLGVLLVLGCATGGVIVATQMGEREAVLALARPVDVGQVLSTRDLRQVSIAVDSSLEVVPADSLSTVRGRPAAYSLPAGTLLTTSALGSPQTPPRGQAIAAVGLKAGQFPPGLEPGNRVTVVVARDSDAVDASSEASSDAWQATVTAVQRRESEQSTVVSVQMAEDTARRLAAAPEGQISVVVVHGGGS